MHVRKLGFALVVVLAAFSPARGQDYALDSNHSAVSFKIEHIGISWTHGRFNDVSGNFSLDGEKSSFALTIKATSIDTANEKRDTHLRSPDFFNVKQYPTITFKSTSVTMDKGNYKVTGDFTMHGETKPVTFTLSGGKTAEFPKGTQRIGFSTELVLKRSDFGIDKFKGAVGEDVHISISFEGVKK